jgi:hypothetical protein
VTVNNFSNMQMNKGSTSNTGYASFQANSNQQEYYFVIYKKSNCDFKKVSFTTTHKKNEKVCNSVIMEF